MRAYNARDQSRKGAKHAEEWSRFASEIFPEDRRGSTGIKYIYELVLVVELFDVGKLDGFPICVENVVQIGVRVPNHHPGRISAINCIYLAC